MSDQGKAWFGAGIGHGRFSGDNLQFHAVVFRPRAVSTVVDGACSLNDRPGESFVVGSMDLVHILSVMGECGREPSDTFEAFA